MSGRRVVEQAPEESTYAAAKFLFFFLRGKFWWMLLLRVEKGRLAASGELVMFHLMYFFYSSARGRPSSIQRYSVKYLLF